MLFYPSYRTPRLTLIKEEGLVNVVLFNGKPLLREPLPEGTPEDQIAKAAYKELLYLAIRDLIDIIPHLGQSNMDLPYIQLGFQDTNMIRRASFLRGHIPYITQKAASLICKGVWKRCLKHPKHPQEIFQGNLDRLRVFSCDWLCSEVNPVVHNDIYANGRPGGGRGFAREWLFSFAEENNIPISSMPMHPLEKQIIILDVGPDKEKPKLRNDLEPMPKELDTPKASKYPLDTKFILDERQTGGASVSDFTFKGILDRIKMDAREPIYRIESQPANRYHMMQYIPWALSEGKTLREICKGVNGTPTMLEIARWLQWYPDFRREMESAEAIQAHVFVDQAQEIIMTSGNDKDVLNLAKAQASFLLKRAALQSEKFREKKVIQTENLDLKNEADIKRKLKMLLKGDSAGVMSEIIDIEAEHPEPEMENQDAI